MRLFEWWVFCWRNRLVWFLQKPLWEFPTRMYVGRPGQGKTQLLIKDVVKLLRKGNRVVANMTIRDPKTGLCTSMVRSWLEVLEAIAQAVEDDVPLIVCIDEVNSWAPSRFSKNTPMWWLSLMAQRRKMRVGFILTSQVFARVEIVLRELVNTVVFCSKIKFFRLQVFGRKAVDPLDVDAAAAGASGTNVQTAAARERLGFGRPVWIRGYLRGAYNTYEVVQFEDWKETPENRRRVDAAFSRIREAAGVDYIPAVTDEWRVILERLSICQSCEYFCSCSLRGGAVEGACCERHERFEGFYLDAAS